MLQPKQTPKEKKNTKDATQMKNMRPVFKGPNSKLPQPKNLSGTAKNGTSMKKAKVGASFGALSVKAGVDSNYGITAADRISGAKMNKGKAKSGTKIKKAMNGYGGKAASMVPGMKMGGMMKKAGTHKMPDGSMMKNSMMKSGGKMKTCKGGC